MSAKDWETYLWDLLPRPYKVLSERERERDPTEARKFINAFSVEAQRVQDMIEMVRDSWLIPSMDNALLDTKGYERGKLARWAGESDDEFRLRVANAFDWFALGGTAAGMKRILELLGYRNVRITERITEDQWAEFGVDIALPSGDALVMENIERVRRIVNEIKAAHTRLVSTNVQYDPPDIGLDPDHMHRYDECYYDLGFWPRPTVHWLVDDSRITERIRMTMGRERYYRVLITSTPTFDVSIYDGPRPPINKLYRARHIRFYTGAFVRGRRWLDPGTWGDAGTWLEVKEFEPRNWAKIERYTFSEAVYDGGEPMDTLNAVYAPAQATVYETQGIYDDEHYDGDRKPPHDKPILRYKSRVISFGESRLPEAVLGKASFDRKQALRSIDNTITWLSIGGARAVHHTGTDTDLFAEWPWPWKPTQPSVYDKQGTFDGETYDSYKKPPHDESFIRSRVRTVNVKGERLPDATSSAASYEHKHLLNSGETAISWSSKRVAKYAQHQTSGMIELADTTWLCSREQAINFKPVKLPDAKPSDSAFDSKHLLHTSDGAITWTSDGGAHAEHGISGDVGINARWIGPWQDKGWGAADVRFGRSQITKESV